MNFRHAVIHISGSKNKYTYMVVKLYNAVSKCHYIKKVIYIVWLKMTSVRFPWKKMVLNVRGYEKQIAERVVLK